MGTKTLGHTAFITSAVGTVGLVGGLWLAWDSFCLFACTPQERAAVNAGVTVAAVSLLLLIAAIVMAAIAIRGGGEGRAWAAGALWVAGLQVLACAVVVLLLALTLSSW